MSLDASALDEALRERLALARRVAHEAGALQRDRYESELDIQTKSAEIDLVTEVDRACEKLIVEAIVDAFPEDSILGEEGGDAGNAAGSLRWVIDPLDGTTNFAHGFPRFAVSIGLERVDEAGGDGEALLGLVYDPLLDERFEAALGHGAWLGARRLHVTPETALGRSLVLTGFSYDLHARNGDDDNLTAFARMARATRGIRRDGSAALDLCYVAAGRVDAYWELRLSPWDVAAGLLMVAEAGGRCTDRAGAPAPRSGREVVASNGGIHDAALAILNA